MLRVLSFLAVALVAQPASAQEVIRLFPQGAPGGALATKAETTETRAPFGTIVRNVSEPTLTVYLPDPARANGTAVIVAPGGGFHMLSIENEGTAVAKWLADHGVAAFVLRYRLLPTGGDFPLSLFRYLGDLPALKAKVEPLRPLDTADGEAAVRHVRANAERFGVHADRVGMMGFSAGGAVTLWTMLAGHADSRPDFAATIYPGLLPDTITAPAGAPPLFLLVAEDDKLARADSVRLDAAWRAAGAKSQLITFASGGHGFGMAKVGKPTDGWIEKMGSWMQSLGVLGK
jgi:acetyl esterase/lipase